MLPIFGLRQIRISRFRYSASNSSSRMRKSTCLAIDCSSFEELENTIDTALKGNVSYCLPVDSVEEGILVTNKVKELLLRKGVL